MKTVFCPLKKDQINGDDCYLLCSIADGEVSSRILPEGVIRWDEEHQEKCLNCKYHYPSEENI